MVFAFTVDGKAVGKARPRVTIHGTYTPRATVEYEKRVRLAYLEQAGPEFGERALVLSVLVVKEPPKSASKATREAMLAGEILPTVKPDFDNYAKVVSDALNGIAWHDDAQIVLGECLKVYGEQARLVAVISDDVQAVKARADELLYVAGWCRD